MNMKAQTIPGLPTPDNRRKLRAELELAKSDSAKAAREMKAAALDLSERVASRFVLADDTPADVAEIALRFLTSRNAMLDADAAAGRVARELAIAEQSDVRMED